MLTLQNDPPNLDTNAERKDQYKNYGKSFRHVIKDCLQKDPTKRPTAGELLKYSFFKKSKDKKFLIHSLIENLGALPPTKEPTMDAPKKVTSGRLKKDKDGNWEFELDQFDEEESSCESDSEGGSPTKDGTPPTTTTEPPSRPPSLRPVASSAPHLCIDEPTTLNLVLRVRNSQRELNDIKFDYTAKTDTVDGISHELVTAGLIDGHDLVVVAANLQKLIELAYAKSDKLSVTFALNSGVAPNESPDERTLTGFAQISLIS
jgi:serine/threonine-protein kinase OSR1/STK39